MDTYAAHIDFDSVDDSGYDFDLDNDFALDAIADDRELQALQRDWKQCAMDDVTEYDDFDDFDEDDL
ncbi:MAG: hypothetical protein AAF493_11475 [Pseudomonadota bacterium]